ncbi:hypothetical protein GQ602_003428 [Ophiocordyceps camponoti-floridani]|uniref:Uncharacterized protein n=1 Tax=Ophiocordyceps camponoti-floridani TaxID=2030778 RepID=A0A8H4Q8K1_9HYPO|nr:hypothetical protein GQ602_003428 [Ophiocordyceps camponoti-floridani]
MSVEVHLLKFLNMDEEVVEWGISIHAISLVEHVRQIFTSAVVLDDAEGTVLYLYTFLRPVAIQELYCRQTTLGQVQSRNYEKMKEFIQAVGFPPDRDCTVHKTSRVWMWRVVEAMVEEYLLPKSALEVCEIDERNKCGSGCKKGAAFS